MDKKHITGHAKVMAEAWIGGETLMVVKEVIQQPSKELAASLAVEIYRWLVSNDHTDDATAFGYALNTRAKAS